MWHKSTLSPATLSGCNPFDNISYLVKLCSQRHLFEDRDIYFRVTASDRWTDTV